MPLNLASITEMLFPVNKRKLRNRRLTAVCIVFVLQLTTTYAQNITLSEENAPLELIFNKIRLQSGYDFIFNQQLLKQAKPITVHLTNKSLQEALDACFLNQPFTYIFQQKTIVVQEMKCTPITNPSGLRTTVRGHVTDRAGKPLPGANIKVRGKHLSVGSASDGSFVLTDLELDTELEISYVGFVTKIISAEADLGAVSLESIVSNLDLVHIIAYGFTSKRFSVGSIGTVAAEEIERQPVSNVLSALQGKVPGLMISPLTGVPGGDFSVQLRGSNSLTGRNEPLYIIDGIPYTSATLSKIGGYASAAGNSNPLNDINPYDIERVTILKDASSTAIYGARGANGVILITMKQAKSGETKVDFNIYHGIGQNVRTQQMMHVADYLDMRRETFRNSASSVFLATDAPELVLWDQTLDRDWQEELLGLNAIYNDVQGSISGGRKQNTFLLSGAYHQETTIFRRNNADQKGSVHFNAAHQSTDQKFKAVLNASYVKSDLTLPTRDITSRAASLPPNQPGIIQNGTLIVTPDDSSPIARDYNNYQSARKNLIANATLSYKIAPGLEIKNNFGFNRITSDEIQINPTSTINSTSGSLNSYVRSANNSKHVWNLEPQLNFNKAYQNGILHILFGGTVQSDSTKGLSNYATGFLDNTQLSNPASAGVVTILDMNMAKTRFSSFFSRIGYSWKEKYILDLSARRDGSSRFGPGKRFGNFGALGIAWVFSKEQSLTKAFPFINFGKLRASYGTVGNIPAIDYQYLSKWKLSGYTYDGISGLQLQNLFNEDFAWEVTKKLEFGLELELFQGRTSLNFDYYHNLSSNQLVNYPLPTMTGFSAVYGNLNAVVRNTGLEFSLQHTHIRTKDLKWTSSLNFSAPRNKLLEFPNLQSSAYRSSFTIGQPIYIRKLYDFADVDPQNGLSRYATAKGLINQPEVAIENKTVLFDSKPKYFGGVGNNIRYRGFELDVFFLYAKQKAIDFQGPTDATSSINLPTRYLDRWRKPGDITNNQLLTYDWTATLAGWQLPVSDRDLVDASYIKLKNVSLSYNFSSELLKSVHIKSCRPYILGQNLLTITRFKGLDPETGNGVSAPLRVLTCGLQFTL